MYNKSDLSLAFELNLQVYCLTKKNESWQHNAKYLEVSQYYALLLLLIIVIPLSNIKVDSL